ncbi:MAG: putative RDD family membrane protein YckC [Bacteroidia bacterium]|jgi:uncharacterized RDD family membrane protein YckC
MPTEITKYSICETCTNRKFDPNSGLICGLTMLKPAFEDSCPDYNIDPFESANRESHIAEFGEQLKGVTPVSAGTRFANFLIDKFVMTVLAGVLFFILDFRGFGTGFLLGPSTLNDYVTGAILTLIYYTFLEAATGRTIGKLITKTVVVKVDEQKPEFQDIVKRSFSRIVPFDILSFLGSGVGWHDKWSNIRVVKKDSALDYKAVDEEILDRSL